MDSVRTRCFHFFLRRGGELFGSGPETPFFELFSSFQVMYEYPINKIGDRNHTQTTIKENINKTRSSSLTLSHYCYFGTTTQSEPSDEI